MLQGWCSLEKAWWLADLIVGTRPSLLVESGVFGGRSIIPQAMALQHNGHGEIVGIDPWRLEASLEGDVGADNVELWTGMDLERIYVDFVRAVLGQHLTGHCSWIRRKSDEAVRLFPDGCIDIFHQDSNHSELISCREVTTWRAKIKRDGYWVLDDSNWETQRRAIELIKESGFRVLEDHGAWMLFRRSDAGP
jgi:hypothetical protein